MLFMCQSRLQVILDPLLQLAILNPFITGDESRKQFAINLTVEQISQTYFQLAQMKSGSSGLKLKSSQHLVPLLSERVARINQEFYGSLEGQEAMKDESQ